MGVSVYSYFTEALCPPSSLPAVVSRHGLASGIARVTQAGVICRPWRRSREAKGAVICPPWPTIASAPFLRSSATAEDGKAAACRSKAEIPLAGP
jgi:hypothetical protein